MVKLAALLVTFALCVAGQTPAAPAATTSKSTFAKKKRPSQFTSLFTTLSDEMKTSFLELTKKMRLAKALPKDQKHAQTKALDMEVHRLLGAKYSEYKAAAGKGKTSKGVATSSAATSAAAAPASATPPSMVASPTSASPMKKKKKGGILKTGTAKKTKSSKPKNAPAPAVP